MRAWRRDGGAENLPRVVCGHHLGRHSAIPRFVILLLGRASLLLGAEAVIVAGGVSLALAVEIVVAALIFAVFTQLAKNYELVPGGGEGNSGGGISTDWSTF